MRFDRSSNIFYKLYVVFTVFVDLWKQFVYQYCADTALINELELNWYRIRAIIEWVVAVGTNRRLLEEE